MLYTNIGLIQNISYTNIGLMSLYMSQLTSLNEPSLTLLKLKLSSCINRA